MTGKTQADDSTTGLGAAGQSGELTDRVSRMEADLRAVLGGIAGDIAVLKQEISVGKATDLAERHIPEAGNELAAVVEMTESASHDIMEAAEAIMSVSADTLDDYRSAVEAEVMKIFEACAFQDITGQRIGKVVETLALIEGRLGSVSADGASAGDGKSANATPGDSDLLNGPALPGEGLEQNAIDAILGDVA